MGFVLVFIIIGFMIMFRARISPQAVATVQDSIPRIVVALVLVTFSYAIAGFMIDLMFVFLNVALNSMPVTDASDIVFKKSIFGVISGSWGETFQDVQQAMGNLINSTIDLKGFNKILGFFGGSIAGIIVGIAMLFIMFKVFIMLLIGYATIIMLTIAAPFFFLFQALPGQSSASTWFKQMAANIMVFPAVAIMFILAGYIGGISALGGDEANPAISATQGNIAKFPLLSGDLDAAILGKLAGIGFLLMTPTAAELVKNAIGAKGGPNVGAAMAGGLAAGAGALAAGGRHAWSGGGPIADYRRARAAKGEAYRGLLGREHANREWDTKNPNKPRPGV
jgi:hypothetical protein